MLRDVEILVHRPALVLESQNPAVGIVGDAAEARRLDELTFHCLVSYSTYVRQPCDYGGSMRHLIVLVTACWLSAVAGMVAPHAATGASPPCSPRDRIQLHQAGYTKAEVSEMCSRSSADIPFSGPASILAGEGQPRWVQWCVTPKGTCSLNPVTSGYYAIGAPCNCDMPWGTYGGAAQ